jgi:hypothetical protein
MQFIGLYESGIKNIGYFWESNDDKAYKEFSHFEKSPPADEYDALFETTYALLTIKILETILFSSSQVKKNTNFLFHKCQVACLDVHPS